jgi:sugar phosphate isomerase/epimerase
MPYGLDEAGTDDAQRTFDLNLSFMTELAGYAKEKNVVVCLENMPMRNFSLATPDKILELVKAVNSDNFKICLDTGHVAVFKELSAGDVVRKLGNEIKVLHVHDNMGDADYHLWPTKGKTDWDDFAKALKEIDFKGVFSLETLPPSSLEDEEFESECIKLYNISKEILNKANI